MEPLAGCAPTSTLMNARDAGAGGTWGFDGVCALAVDAVARARHANTISVFVVFVINLLVLQLKGQELARP